MTFKHLHWNIGDPLSAAVGQASPMRAIDRASGHGAARMGKRWLRRTLEVASTWQERARGRQQLKRLDHHLLRDIGLIQADVTAEAQKPFWRA
ncbi:MAG: DUF1127 domain-containing protein [Geminicoccaceae bacterium]